MHRGPGGIGAHGRLSAGVAKGRAGASTPWEWSGQDMTAGLERIFLDLRPALARYLLARGVAADEADDLLQDVYLKLGSPRGPVDEPRAYLYRMTHNLLLDRRRSAGRRVRRDDAWSSGGTGIAVESDPRPSAEQSLIAREQLTAMVAAIAALPVRTGDIFRRYRLDGQPQQGIADDLGISKSAVEKHLYRAFAAMTAARSAFDARSQDATNDPPQRRKDMRSSHDA